MSTDPPDTDGHSLPTETSPETSPRQVLIVEDDEELAGLLRVWLRDLTGETASIRVANTIADARALLESGSALDIVLLDRRLPDGTANDLLETTCQFDAITVMITAVSPGSDLIRYPVDDYLVKPIDNETLVTKLSLLEKLRASNALEPYTDARKASLLEYHLDSPQETPLFRRFAARWSYDRLEIAHCGGQAVVYELYADETTADRDDGSIRVSITGTLADDIDDLLDDDAVEPVGELLPSGDDYAWIQADGDRIDRDPESDSIAIYGFTCETPEQYVADDPVAGSSDAGATELNHVELASILESGFN